MGHIFGKLKVNSTRWILNLKIDLDMTPPLNEKLGTNVRYLNLEKMGVLSGHNEI